MFKSILCLLVFGVLMFLCCAVHSSSLPPNPIHKKRVKPVTDDEGKARRLFELSRRENRRLRWNTCLSEQAYYRARKLVIDKQFDHRDPVTGDNPAWELMRSCGRWFGAAENLAKGSEPAETIHHELMQSPTHRRNILDPQYNQLGVGCYDYICVELFADFSGSRQLPSHYQGRYNPHPNESGFPPR